MPSQERLDTYADLVVKIGGNVQEGQDMVVVGWMRANRWVLETG